MFEFAGAAQDTGPVANPAPVEQSRIAYPPSYFAGYRPANALEMIDRVPGFIFDSGSDVRGYEGAVGNVLVDGQRPASKSDTLDEVLRRIPASEVERIELIRGGAPGIDMQGKSVVANVVRRSGSAFHGLVSVVANYVVDDGRTAPIVRVEGSGGRNGRKWEVSARSGIGVADAAGDGPRIRIDANGQVIALSAVESEGAQSQSSLTGAYETPIGPGQLRVNGRVSLSEFEFDLQSHATLPRPQLDLDHYGDDSLSGEVGARYRWNLSPSVTGEIIGLQRNSRDHFGETVSQSGRRIFFSTDARGGESIGRATFTLRPRANLAVEVGAEGAFNWQDSDTRLTQNGTAVIVPGGNVRVEELRGEAFLKATWRPALHWTFEGGVRQEISHISSEKDVVLSKTLAFTKPRVAITWAPAAQWQVRARLERTVDQLDFSDFVATSDFNSGGDVKAGNPDLEPEQAWVGELALERRFWNTGALILTGRRSELRDVVDLAPIFADSGVFDAPANIGRGTKDEISLSLTLPLDRLGVKSGQFRGVATRRWSRVTDPTTGERRPISALRPLEWEAHFVQDITSWKLSYGVDVTGAWRQTSYRIDEIQIQKLKTFVTAFVEWRPQRDLSVRGEVGNLTSRGIRTTRYSYTGLRGSSPFEYVDDRDIQFGPMLYLRIRKTFGS